ncbi:MAG TPA: hypothetical protein VGM08_01145 [Candidatus Saccharimonadales bacterium]
MARKPNYRDPRQWPELQSVSKTSLQAFTEKMVQVEAAEARKSLIRRAGVLVAVVIVALLSAAQTLIVVIPQLWRGDGAFDVIVTPLSAFNAAMQIIASGYFIVGKDPDFGVQIVRWLLILNGLELLTGLAVASSLALTLLQIVLLYLAYQKLQSLRKHWF